MKTRVMFKEDSYLSEEWIAGDSGYIDGYLMQNGYKPFAVVVKYDGKIVLAHISVLKVL